MYYHVHSASGSSLVAIDSLQQVVAIAHVHIECIKDTTLAPTARHLGRIGRPAERPVVGGHLFRCVRIDFLGERRALHIRLTAVGHIHRLLGYIFAHSRVVAEVIARVGAVITPFVEERIVVATHTRTVATGERFEGGERRLVAEILGLDHRITEEHKTVLGYVHKECIHDTTPFGIHMLTLVAVVGGVVPLAPNTHKTCFDDIDDIGVLLQMRFELLQMAFYPVGCRIHFVAGSLGISKTQHTFETVVTQLCHVFVKTFQHFLRQVLRLEIVEVVEHNHQRHLVVVAPTGTDVTLDDIGFVFAHFATVLFGETAFGVTENRRVVRRIVNRDCLRIERSS